MSAKTGQRGRKVIAIAAVAAVLGVGVYGTLASWNDNEWVVAGINGDGAPDVRTDTFEVQQNRDQAPASTAAFGDFETNEAAGDLVFVPETVALSPGTTIYAPVALRTAIGSLGGDVTLQAPVPSTVLAAVDADELLWDALTYSVRATATATSCDASTWTTFGTDVLTDADLATGATTAQSLAAGSDSDPGAIQFYCFAITLPENPAGVPDVNELQGRSVHPAWNFASESTS